MNVKHYNQTVISWGLYVVSAVFIVLGIWEYLSPFILGIEMATKVDLLPVQGALIPLKPHPLAHVVITLTFPLLALITGLLAFRRVAIGWWAFVMLGSFGTFLFASGFFKLYIFRLYLLKGYLQSSDFFMLKATELELLSRMLFFLVVFMLMFHNSVMNTFGITGVRRLHVAGGLLIFNVILALILYDFNT
jgi:hypothetical protein